ncbi:DUF6879 family protein [Nocardiopsis terrae]|uniref:DUF6879 family protein n=1 Tax=Streptomyces sp. NPDC057554 TaxID=3350538 RepID=UPI0036B8AF9C
MESALTRIRVGPCPVLSDRAWLQVVAELHSVSSAGAGWWVEVTPHGEGPDDPVWAAWRRGRPHYASALMMRAAAWRAQHAHGAKAPCRLWVPCDPFRGDQVYVRDVLRARERAGQPVRVVTSQASPRWARHQALCDLVVLPDRGVFAPRYVDGVPAGAVVLSDTRVASAVAQELASLWEKAVPIGRWSPPTGVSTPQEGENAGDECIHRPQ